MNDKEIPEDLKIISEELEPTFQRVIGKFFAQCEFFRKQHSTACVSFVDQCESWWYTMEGMNRMTIGISTAIHASLFISNNLQIVDKYIEKHLGFSPILKREELKRTSFRNLAKDLEMSCIFNKELHLTTETEGV